jgi:glycosyltransferase involved in cell wall biosynthesis
VRAGSCASFASEDDSRKGLRMRRLTRKLRAVSKDQSSRAPAGLAVVQVNTHDDAGGAARVARDLHEGLLRAGEQSHLAVGRKCSADDSVCRMENNKYRNPWSRFWLAAESALEQAPVSFRGKGGLGPLLADVALPARALAIRRGVDYSGYPAAWHPEDWAASAELVHLHNLHGEYFDMRALPMLTARYPTVLTLHDAWLLAGHCAHSYDCERWRTGCGSCPDLSIPPEVNRDKTAQNWCTKRDIFAASRLHVATPSRWLMEKVEASMLAPAIAEARVIPNGVDLGVFKPRDKRKARAVLGLPDGAHVLVFAAHGGRTNPWKDFSTIEAAAVHACQMLDRQVILVVIGGLPGSEELGSLRIHYVPHLSDRDVLASYLAAADVCVHAANADNFSLWLSESLACGTPAVSVRIGGIPEVVKDGVTGLVVDRGDVSAFARALVTLLRDDELRTSMGKAASEYAIRHLSLDRMIGDYRCWYRELMDRREAGTHG